MVQFNAHRIFMPEVIIDTLNELKLSDFALIKPVKGRDILIEHEDYRNVDVEFATGLFEFLK